MNFNLKSLVCLALFLLGGTAIAFGQYRDSLRTLFSHTEELNQKLKYSRMLAWDFLGNGDFDSAETYFFMAFRVDDAKVSSSAKVLSLEGLAYINGARRNFPLADSLFEEAFVLSEDDSLKTWIAFNWASVRYRGGRSQTINEILEKVAPILPKLDEPELWVAYYNSLHHYYEAMGDDLNSLNSLLNAKKYSSKDMKKALIVINHNLGNKYETLRAYDEGLKAAEENLILSQAFGDDHDIAYSYFALASFESELGNFDRVKNYVYQAIQHRNKTGISVGFGYNYYQIGNAHLQTGNIDSAVFYAHKGIEISKAQFENDILADNYFLLVNIFLEKGDTLGAMPYAQEIMKLKPIPSSEEKNALAKIYTKKQDYPNSYFLLEENIDEYIRNEEKNTIYRMANSLLMNSFEQEKQFQKSLSEQALQSQRIKYGRIGLIILVLIISCIIIIQNRNSKKLQEVNDRLIRKNEELFQFTYICSHDLKEPIRNVSTFAGLVQNRLEKENLKQSYSEYFNYIFNGVNTLSTIVSSLKSLSEIEGKSITGIEKEWLAPIKVYEKAIGNLEVFVREKMAIVSFKDLSGGEEIYTSRDDLSLVLQNLIHNAIKYNQSEQARVEVTFEKNQEYATLNVIDNGIGIKEEYFEYIFKPFKTMGNKGETNSSGLGLAICQKIVSQLDGLIRVKSVEGKGSVFSIMLNN
ncbi:MAG: tetratricopeptide repeat-containing sensor histidine kinase [Bacteroidia bacterium]|nr:tetratricopeptide repeat-containing sensor histidine kinase [Bacteroidia bacterium]